MFPRRCWQSAQPAVRWRFANVAKEDRNGRRKHIVHRNSYLFRRVKKIFQVLGQASDEERRRFKARPFHALRFPQHLFIIKFERNGNLLEYFFVCAFMQMLFRRRDCERNVHISHFVVRARYEYRAACRFRLHTDAADSDKCSLIFTAEDFSACARARRILSTVSGMFTMYPCRIPRASAIPVPIIIGRVAPSIYSENNNAHV